MQNDGHLYKYETIEYCTFKYMHDMLYVAFSTLHTFFELSVINFYHSFILKPETKLIIHLLSFKDFETHRSV